MLVLGLAVAIALAVASLAANWGGGKGTCKVPWVAACAGQAPSHGSRTTAHTIPLALMMPTIGDSRPAPSPVPVSAGFG
jgi:hypothetical protein